MKKVFVAVLYCILFTVNFSSADAQMRGVGVSPAVIDIEDVEEWPYTTSLFVTNLSEDPEFFEVTGVAAYPGRFVIEGKETSRVLLTFERPEQGTIRVVAKKENSEGLTTGTGMEVPFSVSGQPLSLPLAADVSQAVLPGAAIIFFSLVALWYVSDIARRTIFASKA